MSDEETVEPQTEGDAAAKIDAAINRWVASHIHGSPVAQSTEIYNYVFRSLDALKAELLASL